MTPEQHYEIYKAKSKPQIRSAIAQMSGGIKEVEIARLALEDIQSEEREQFEKELLKQQHDLNNENIRIQNKFNRENIELQNRFNAELAENQNNLYKRLQIFMVIAVILAAIIGGIIGAYAQYLFQSNSQSKMIKLKAEQTQTQTKKLPSGVHNVPKIDKVP